VLPYPVDGVGKSELAKVGKLLVLNLEGGNVGWWVFAGLAEPNNDSTTGGQRRMQRVGGDKESQKEGNGKYPHGFALSDMTMVYIRILFITASGGGGGGGGGGREARDR